MGALFVPGEDEPIKRSWDIVRAHDDASRKGKLTVRGCVQALDEERRYEAELESAVRERSRALSSHPLPAPYRLLSKGKLARRGPLKGAKLQDLYDAVQERIYQERFDAANARDSAALSDENERKRQEREI